MRAAPAAAPIAPQAVRSYAVPRTSAVPVAPQAAARSYAVPRVAGPVVGQAVPRPNYYVAHPYYYAGHPFYYGGHPYYYYPHPYYYYPYGYYPYYAFHSHFSIGFGFYVGYPIAYPVWYNPYAVSTFGYGVSAGVAYGGLSFDMQPAGAAVFIDGVFVGAAADFGPTAAPLTLRAGLHHVELRADGFQPIAFDITVVPGQVIPYQGTMPAIQ